MKDIKRYPLIFQSRDLIAGKKFFAVISIKGQVLLEKEDCGVWLYGVQPGGIAAGGADVIDAFREFKRGYLLVLDDIAHEAATFKEFKKQVRLFTRDMNESVNKDWVISLDEAHKNSLPGLQVEKIKSNKCRVQVVLLDPQQATPKLNNFDNQYFKQAI